MDFQMSDLQYFDPEEWFQYANNINSYTDLGLVVGKVQKPIMPQVQENTQDVPGMYGNIFTGNDYGELTFNIPVTLMSFDHTSYNIIIENLRAMLTADSADPGVEYPLVFGDRPNVKYYGHWGQISDPTFLTPTDWQAQTNLTFICSQPYGYLPQDTIKLTHPDQTFVPKGNTTTYPTYQAYLKKDIYNIGFNSVNSNGQYVATGYTVDSENTDDQGNRIQDNEPLVDEEVPTLLSTDWTQWHKPTFNIDGDIAGAMDDHNFWNSSPGIMPATVIHNDPNRTHTPKAQNALNYGYSGYHNNWYGPLAMHNSFPNPTDDWRIMVNLWNRKDSSDHVSDRAMGHCEIYLLDDQGNRRGKIWIHDWQKGEMPRVGFSLGKSISDDIDMINPNDPSQKGNHDGRGPIQIGNYHVQRNRPTPPNGFIVKSLFNYVEEVNNAKKANKRSVRQANNKTRATRATTSTTGYKYKTGDSNRRIHHNYPTHRKSGK